MKSELIETRIFSDISEIIKAARSLTAKSVNIFMTLAYFEIGKVIVEIEQDGAVRSKYSAGILKNLSLKLTGSFGKGFSVDNLENMRKFYILFKDRISETPSRILGLKEENKSETLSSFLSYQTITSTKKEIPFKLSWSHYVFLIKLKNTEERSFYEIEAVNQNWSLRELKRQFDTSLYERLALSRNKDKVKKLSSAGLQIENPADVIKDPYILEFLNLKEESSYSESELENEIINNIEKFILELGKGFLFSGRQVRFTFDEEHFFVDLVFYNRILRCFVLIDLKIGKLKHQDLGQMQMYVNYYDRFVKTDDENKSIGILLCKDKNQSMVEITLPEENTQIFASKYQLYLPSKEELKKQIELSGSIQ